MVGLLHSEHFSTYGVDPVGSPHTASTSEAGKSVGKTTEREALTQRSFGGRESSICLIFLSGYINYKALYRGYSQHLH